MSLKDLDVSVRKILDKIRESELAENTFDVQLYDLEKDLKETNNIADEYPEITKSMREAIERFKAEFVPGS